MVQIERIELVVGDLDMTRRFYVEALGFNALGTSRELALKRASLQLGGTRLDLLAYDAPGAAYPARRAANNLWFQHFAIAVSDMPSAYSHLSTYPHEPVSLGGPQMLPPSTGSVTAYKFRDPEGHPLELSFNPATASRKIASNASSAATTLDLPFTGIDHSAITVADLETSIAFYTGLGFRVSERLVNTGLEQDQLDGLPGVVLDIIVLTGAAGPHLELLHYRSPRACESVVIAPADIAATRLVLAGSGASGLRQDPDGHWLRSV